LLEKLLSALVDDTPHGPTQRCGDFLINEDMGRVRFGNRGSFTKMWDLNFMGFVEKNLDFMVLFHHG
jgi:hypothetical protein